MGAFFHVIHVWNSFFGIHNINEGLLQVRSASVYQQTVSISIMEDIEEFI